MVINLFIRNLLIRPKKEQLKNAPESLSKMEIFAFSLMIKDKKEKYGRYLALIYVKIDQSILTGLTDIRSIGDFYCLNDMLIAKGLAKKYMI